MKAVHRQDQGHLPLIACGSGRGLSGRKKGHIGIGPLRWRHDHDGMDSKSTCPDQNKAGENEERSCCKTIEDGDTGKEYGHGNAEQAGLVDGEKLEPHETAVNSQGEGKEKERGIFQPVGIAAGEEQDKGEQPEKGSA